jgi:hypothetical protein
VDTFHVTRRGADDWVLCSASHAIWAAELFGEAAFNADPAPEWLEGVLVDVKDVDGVVLGFKVSADDHLKFSAAPA